SLTTYSTSPRRRSSSRRSSASRRSIPKRSSPASRRFGRRSAPSPATPPTTVRQRARAPPWTQKGRLTSPAPRRPRSEAGSAGRRPRGYLPPEGAKWVYPQKDDPRGSGMLLLGGSVAVELAIERLAVEAEHLCGERLVAADALEHAQDIALFYLFERHEL